MTDQNLGLPKRRDHRGVFHLGTGVMCAVAVTLAGCAGTSQKKLLEAEQAKLAKSEKARKSAVQKLAEALTANKAKDKKLRAAQRATGKYRTELKAADQDIADLEERLAAAKASQVKAAEGQAGIQHSQQRIENLEARLEESIKERDVLKAQLARAQEDAAGSEVEMSAATSAAEEKARQTGHSGVPAVSTRTEKRAVKHNCERVLQQAAELDKELRQSRAKREKLNEKLLASLDKIESISMQHAEEQRAAALEVKTLRDQLAKAKHQVSDDRVEAGSVDGVSSAGNQCNNR